MEAAYAALGVARAESTHRRVVIGDLAGEVAPIQALVGTADPHGIYDSFTFGTSLERVIYPVAGSDNLKLLPSRSEEHTSELQSRLHLVCRLLLEKKKHDHPRDGTYPR